MKKQLGISVLCAGILFFVTACSGNEELSEEAINALGLEGLETILAKTVSKPWRGEEFVPGRLGGTWNSVVSADPKSFNIQVSEGDSATSAVVGAMQDYLSDYDTVTRQWKPHCASAEIIADEDAGTLDVIYTLRDDLYWTWYDSDRKVPVTSDDIVFWYNEIEGDPAFNSSLYNSQFVTMPDGTEARIDIEKLDDRRFVFHFPRIVAEPLLATNRDIAPRTGYEEAKRERGVQGVLDLFNVETDPRTIPSMGKWFLVEYTPQQRLVYKRNPAYWDKDAVSGLSLPFYEEEIARIIPDENTQLLLFKQGDTDSYGLRPEDLDELVNKQFREAKTGIAGFFQRLFGKNFRTDYTVFNAEGALSASMWIFNQNPVNKDAPYYEWFTQKEFRQAMSCLLNRDRIISQVYRGLAEPKLNFFPEPNPYYNGGIQLQYLYDQSRALALLESIGFSRDGEGVLRDGAGRAVEFDLTIRSDSSINTDIASIFMDELAQAGIKLNIRTLDFQKMVEQLFTTFDWQSMIMGLSGANIFPTQGSNVWPSTGNLHMWYPLQPQPATDWEARVDYLYNEGAYTIDQEKAKAIWDEYQAIILEQCPVIYLVRPRSFAALRDRWDQANVYFDNTNGFETTHLFLKP
ncbi:MAG: ABC transporter substrate-binding protein [Spirochaetaceae bacterium]|jgi:peptide/nickel transport system substrate-binding protein|nr:ABC transporter substrate-binding protein [Spirochaetaceae bacterium]